MLKAFQPKVNKINKRFLLFDMRKSVGCKLKSKKPPMLVSKNANNMCSISHTLLTVCAKRLSIYKHTHTVCTYFMLNVINK